MGGSPAPTVVATAPPFTTTPRPSHTTITVSMAGDALPFVAANTSDYGVNNPASPNNDMIVPAADASKFVFGSFLVSNFNRGRLSVILYLYGIH